jgi:hypothetical protein
MRTEVKVGENIFAIEKHEDQFVISKFSCAFWEEFTPIGNIDDLLAVYRAIGNVIFTEKGISHGTHEEWAERIFSELFKNNKTDARQLCGYDLSPLVRELRRAQSEGSELVNEENKNLRQTIKELEQEVKRLGQQLSGNSRHWE